MPIKKGGGNYSPKTAYDGVAAAINGLADQDDFGFAALNPGSGTTADCGGMGSLEPEVISIGGPVAVAPGGQVTVPVAFVSTGNQDIVLTLQLDSDPFTVYSEATVPVSEGTGTENVTLSIPLMTPAGDGAYRYQAYLTPTGEGIAGSVNNLVRSGITVLGEDSQLIISISGPETVGRGDTAAVEVTYSAVAGQEIVVWFQLDQSPFTTFQEFREEAATGLNTITAKLFIPLDVPIAEDAYQFQTILVPTGGGWPERISNVGQPNVDVEIGTSIWEVAENSIPLRAYPNPTAGWLTVELPPSSEESTYRIYSARGRLISEGNIGGATSRMRIDVVDLPEGIYVLQLQRGAERGVVRFIRR